MFCVAVKLIRQMGINLFCIKFYLFILVRLMFDQSINANNIDPASALRIKPSKQNDTNANVSYQFGTSMEIKRNGNEYTLIVGAPYYYATDRETESGQPIKNGSVYECAINLQSQQQTCDRFYTYYKNGAMGMTLQNNMPANELLVCGNQYTFECPEANIIQRMIGSCYKHYYGSEEHSEITSPCTDECPRRALVADIVFALDESTSVTTTGWQSTLNWVIELLSSFRVDIDNGNVLVGVITFDANTRIDVPLSKYHYNELTNLLNAIPYNGGPTHIGKAILAATRQLHHTGRSNVPKEMIVLTDGESADDVRNPARSARQQGITTVAVGVGSGAKQFTLEQIAGDVKRIFKASDYNNLNSVVDGLRFVIEDSAETVLEGQNFNSSNNLTQCQMGMSADIFHKDTTISLYVGAVGAYDRSGSVVAFDNSAKGFATNYNHFLDEENLKSFIYPEDFVNFKEAYLGYSTTVGKFEGGNLTFVASGAPNYFSKGVVAVYNPSLNSYPTSSNYLLHPHNSSDLWQLGAYFGHSLCSIDLNKDGFDDLLVSAPLYSDVSGYDQGRVFVYMNDQSKPGLQGWMSTDFYPQILTGTNSIGARFGMSVVVGGDIDQNGYDDIIIGAPYETPTSKGSGSVYIYYVTENGISDLIKQRIVGSEVSSSLETFGMSILQGSSSNYDIDDNNYPDVVVSAPSSDEVVVLLSKPVVEVSAEIVIDSPVIDFINCLNNINDVCTTFQVCFSAFQRSSNISSFELEVEISVDSLVPDDETKLLVFSEEASSKKRFLENVTNFEKCKNYNVNLNENAFASLISGKSLAVAPQVEVSYNFSKNHQAQTLSAVLMPNVASKLVGNWTYITCLDSNQQCFHDLSVTASYSIPSSSEPYVLEDNPESFRVTINIRNNGPDLSLFTKISVYSDELEFSKIIGSCAQVVDNKNDTLLLSISVGAPSVGSLLPQEECDFTLLYPLDSIANGGQVPEISINGHAYSSYEIETEKDNNEDNNYFNYQRSIRYSADLTIVRNAHPPNLFYNRLQNDLTIAPTFIETLQDPVLGNNTDIEHTYTVINVGPSGISQATLSLTWPSSLLANNVFPLLYLYEFQCLPSSICECDVVGKVNPFNLSVSNHSYSNVSLEFPSPNQFPANTDCTSVQCDLIECNLTKLQQFKYITVSAMFKLWLPSFSEPNVTSLLTSSLEVNLSHSLIYEPFEYVAIVTTTASAYKSPEIIEEDTGSDVGSIIGGVIGGLAVVGLLSVALWKVGFFRSKYAERLRAATEIENNQPQGGAIEEASGVSNQSYENIEDTASANLPNNFIG